MIRVTLIVVLSAGIAVLAGCSSSQVQPDFNYADTVDIPAYSSLKGIEKQIASDRVNSIPRTLALDGIKHLSDGKLVEANTAFNRALMYDPSDSYLQWLNGVTYHLRATQGESPQYEMAKQAYSLSIRFDPSNWMAHYQLGLLYLDTHEYPVAQDAFAEALLFRPNDPDLLYQMMYVSYFNFDPEAANAALRQLRNLEPNSDRVLRAAPVIMASMGEHALARKELAVYREQESGQRRSVNLGQRIQDWESFYQSHEAGVMTVATSSLPANSEVEEAAEEAEILEFAKELDSEMVIVDVAIIESEEDLGTRKGVNLLNGLRLQFGLDRTTVDNRQENTVITGPGEDTLTESFSRTLTKAISIPQIEYSLNIFNSEIFTNEVLARPTLVALNGQPSRFFAGSNVQAAATASSTVGAVSGGAAVKLNEDIGVDMSITPTLREDGLVRIDVDIMRTFLEVPDSSIDFEYKLQTAKTHVNASVVMAFGETLILSGLSEKESETFRDGVPILQDIPIIQYLFSEERTLDYQKSALVLITPRRPFTLNSMTEEQESVGERNEDAPLRELRKRFDAWFEPAPHWVSIAQHLEGSGLYREFRTGDLALEIWAESEAFRKRFGDVVEFLYY